MVVHNNDAVFVNFVSVTEEGFCVFVRSRERKRVNFRKLKHVQITFFSGTDYSLHENCYYSILYTKKKPY